MSEHKAGLIGVIGGSIVAGCVLVTAFLLYYWLTRRVEGELGPGALGLGVCVTPLAIGFGAWLGSFTLRRLVRLTRS